jgi:hypothetical protein
MSDVSQVQADVTQVKGDFQADIAKVQKEVALIQAECQQTSASQKKQDDVQGQLQTELKELRADHTKLEAIAQKQSQQVAFQAWRKQARTLNLFDPVVYNEVELNKGDAYNPQTRVFTAPVTGLYCFMATTHGGEVNKGWGTWLAVEGTLVSLMHTQGKSCITNHVAVHINAGVKVRVVSFRDDKCPLTVTRGSFTGFLVQPDP